MKRCLPESALALGLAMLGALSTGLWTPAQAQVQLTGKRLPLAIAADAAQEAVRSCEASGYKVSASVVDVAGVERAFLRSDASTIHTREIAFKKAYTIATLGPIFGATTASALTERIGKTPTGPALSGVSNIILLAGGVAVRSGDEVLAALGVGGAPGGQLDESLRVSRCSKGAGVLECVEHKALTVVEPKQ